MRKVALGTGAVLVAAGGSGGVIVSSGAEPVASAAQDAPATTAQVERGTLSAAVSQDGILTYRAQADGSPFTVVNHARGVYTRLPDTGDKVRCGGTLYRVDDRPVVLLCGSVPAYRTLRVGTRGRDVRQLNRHLRLRGGAFTARTKRALKALQRRKGMRMSGVLRLGDAVLLPAAARIAKVTGKLGGAAGPGAPVLDATSDTLHVQVNLAPSQQGEVEKGDRARVTLPGNTLVRGRVAGFGRVAETPADENGEAAEATIPVSIRLDDPRAARGLDRAPVGVDITTDGVENALSVPVTALVGKAGGGFAVEVVRSGGRRELVGVDVGLFDTAGGRVQVTGALDAGDDVVVPSP